MCPLKPGGGPASIYTQQRMKNSCGAALQARPGSVCMSFRKLKRLFQGRRRESSQASARPSHAVPSDNILFVGSYATWTAALHDATGYDSAVILEKTRTALLKV
jgi:hypothetical protein